MLIIAAAMYHVKAMCVASQWGHCVTPHTHYSVRFMLIESDHHRLVDAKWRIEFGSLTSSLTRSLARFPLGATAMTSGEISCRTTNRNYFEK